MSNLIERIQVVPAVCNDIEQATHAFAPVPEQVQQEVLRRSAWSSHNRDIPVCKTSSNDWEFNCD